MLEDKHIQHHTLAPKRYFAREAVRASELMRQHLLTPIPIIRQSDGRENAAWIAIILSGIAATLVPDIFFPGFSASGLFASKILLCQIGVTIHPVLK